MPPLASPLPPTTTTKFCTLSFPPFRHKLGSRILVSDSQPHCRRVMVLSKMEDLGLHSAGRGARTLVSTDFLVWLPPSLQGPFTSSPNLWPQFQRACSARALAMLPRILCPGLLPRTVYAEIGLRSSNPRLSSESLGGRGKPSATNLAGPLGHPQSSENMLQSLLLRVL